MQITNTSILTSLFVLLACTLPVAAADQPRPIQHQTSDYLTLTETNPIILSPQEMEAVKGKSNIVVDFQHEIVTMFGVLQIVKFVEINELGNAYLMVIAPNSVVEMSVDTPSNVQIQTMITTPSPTRR